MTRPQGPQIQQNIIIRHNRISHPATGQTLRSRVLAGALALTIAGGVLVGSPVLIGAQDGTGGAVPTVDTKCDVPTASWDASAATVSAPTVTPTIESTATPVIRTSSTPIASPDASPVASPVVTATTAPTEMVTPVPDASDALTDDLTATANAITACLSENDAETLVSITSNAFRGQLIGSDQAISADNYIALSASLSVLPYSLVSLTDATATGDDTATAIVTYTVGKQIRSGEWSFQLDTVDSNPVWILSSEAPQSPETPANVATVDVTIAKDAYDFSSDALSASDVEFAISNTDDIDHEFFVVQLAAGTDVSSLLTNPGPGLPNGVTFVGQVTLPAGSEGSLLLADLAPGTYTVVDLLPDDEGIPHLSNGMQATFTVK